MSEKKKYDVMDRGIYDPGTVIACIDDLQLAIAHEADPEHKARLETEHMAFKLMFDSLMGV